MPAQGPIPDGRDDFGLIETLLFTRESGCPLLAGHRARLQKSAEALGFPWRAEDFDEALARAIAMGSAPALRLRLVLRRDGGFETSATAFVADAPGKIWCVAIAAQRFDSSEKMLRHKTTRRDIYEKALAQAQKTDARVDEVLFLNERDEICEGARTNVFLPRDKVLLTPPLCCGLLPGVFRADLLARGFAREALLRLEDLGAGFALGNALRGPLRASLLR